MELTPANGHGVSATPENVSRCCHDRFPHPGLLPEGEGDSERAAHDFHGNPRGQGVIERLRRQGASAVSDMSAETKAVVFPLSNPLSRARRHKASAAAAGICSHGGR
jgi:hypothetical protein